MTEQMKPLTAAEFKDRLGNAIRRAFKNASDSPWVSYVSEATETWGPEEWDDILDYMMWDLLRQGMMPPGLDPELEVLPPGGVKRVERGACPYGGRIYVLKSSIPSATHIRETTVWPDSTRPNEDWAVYHGPWKELPR